MEGLYMPSISDITIENIQDLICNIKDAMKDVFMPRDELTNTYAAKNHTHPIDNALNSNSTNPVQNKVIKAKTDSIETALNNKSNIDHSHADASANSSGFLSANLFTKLSNIATGATKNNPSSTNPLMDGTVSKGSENDYARGDHRHPTDTTRAPNNHASSATTYGVSSTSNYGHSMATSTVPKALAYFGSLGSETTKFARGDHVHPLPAMATPSSDGLMDRNDKSKLDGIPANATVNNRNVKIGLFSPSDAANGTIINITQGQGLRFDILTEFDTPVPANYKVFYSINGVEYSRSNGGTHVISNQLPAGDYRMDMIFKGGGVYNPVYRTVTLRVSA